MCRCALENNGVFRAAGGGHLYEGVWGGGFGDFAGVRAGGMGDFASVRGLFGFRAEVP